jgi:hypothetical protein
MKLSSAALPDLAPADLLRDALATLRLEHRAAQWMTPGELVHKWDDKRALSILRNVRRAMQRSAPLISFEIVLDPIERRIEATMSDLPMLVVCSGRERTLAPFRSLLEQTGFTMRHVLHGVDNPMREGIAK